MRILYLTSALTQAHARSGQIRVCKYTRRCDCPLSQRYFYSPSTPCAISIYHLCLLRETLAALVHYCLFCMYKRGSYTHTANGLLTSIGLFVNLLSNACLIATMG
jgi:hypothetical protein